mmetsp:Transcript_37225/g.119910  ORF Transcript_37225/g.119910 Transcript_37225/m.119910 type:complete len:273 (+) Transcript_37225:83-901(+)
MCVCVCALLSRCHRPLPFRNRAATRGFTTAARSSASFSAPSPSAAAPPPAWRCARLEQRQRRRRSAPSLHAQGNNTGATAETNIATTPVGHRGTGCTNQRGSRHRQGPPQAGGPGSREAQIDSTIRSGSKGPPYLQPAIRTATVSALPTPGCGVAASSSSSRAREARLQARTLEALTPSASICFALQRSSSKEVVLETASPATEKTEASPPLPPRQCANNRSRYSHCTSLATCRCKHFCLAISRKAAKPVHLPPFSSSPPPPPLAPSAPLAD